MMSRIVLHPFLFAIFPIASLLSTNIGDALPRDALLPCLLAEGLAIVAWLALWPLLPDPRKRGLLLSLLIVAFYGYGAVVDATRNALDFRAMLGPAQLAAAAALACVILGGAIYGLRRWEHPFTAVTAILNTMSIGAIILAVATTAFALVGQRQFQASRATPATESPVEIANPLEQPDVYYVILDAYARADYLKDFYGHDNEPFLDELRERGFYIADRSRSNYVFTLVSLSSSMNLDYLEDSLAQSSVDDWDRATPKLSTLIWDSHVVEFFKTRGYEFVTFATWLASFEIPTADRLIEPDRFRITAFHEALIDMTPVRSLLNRMERHRFEFPFLFALDELGGIERDGKPLFVFAHVLGPHLPHIVDAEGNPRESPPPYREGYRDEVTYINSRILEIVDEILARQPNSIIILQGDHGPRSDWRGGMHEAYKPWNGTMEEYFRDRSAILNAYYFPDGNYERLYPEITPVNSFRTVLNQFFGSSFPVLEDVTYVHMHGLDRLLRVEEVY